jgi:hypothetical protein
MLVILSGVEAAKWAERSRRIPCHDSSAPCHDALQPQLKFAPAPSNENGILRLLRSFLANPLRMTISQSTHPFYLPLGWTVQNWRCLAPITAPPQFWIRRLPGLCPGAVAHHS